ncbi:MAG: S41 family peptidase [Bacteroidaceae bacterium]|nr:S41 family peptidase [Bacteroidaceae bacterium]
MKKTATAILCLSLLSVPVCAQGLRVIPQNQPQRAVQQQRQTVGDQLQKLLVAESAISSLYVDETDESSLVENAIIGMLKDLDPHSTYLTPEENDKSNETLTGSFDGIGVQFNMIEDTLLIIQPIADGPSEKAGIMAGDRIVSVNDTAIAGVRMSQENIMKRLRGPKGTHVKLGVVRRGVRDVIEFNVVRDNIPVNTVDAWYMMNPTTGYIKVSSFGATTVDEFEEKLSDLQSRGATSLVLDLQGNGGGLLMAAVGIANEFLKRDQLVVYTEGRRSPKSGYLADGRGRFRDGRLVVLIDEYSASASEIVSGALQDWDRATIIGRRSFGKGLVQRPVEFHDGSLIRLTVAKYFTPVGRCIQKPYGKDVDYGEDILERLHHGELTNADSIHFPDSLKYSTMVSHRTVYGGGGIMPDIFVPLDTTRTNQYYRDVTAKNVTLQTAFQYTEKNRRQLQRRYPDFESFNAQFECGKDVMDMFLAKAKDLKVEYREDQYKHCLDIFKVQLKAMIARNVWGLNGYYRIIQTLDDTVQRAAKYCETGE